MAAAFGFIFNLGVVTVSLIPLLESLVKPPAEAVTNLRIGAGSLDFEDGNVPSVRLFDLEGTTIGFSKANGDKIGRGVGHDMTITHLGDNDVVNQAAAQAEYIAVIQGGNDALCISYITVTTPDGIKYGWFGDVGASCAGSHWYYGNTTAGLDSNNGEYQPKCMWIDGDDSAGYDKKAFSFHLPSFLTNQARADQYLNDNDLMCGAAPRFSLYTDLSMTDPIKYFSHPMFDTNTLLDFDRNDTLNPANWLDTPAPIFDLSKRETELAGNSTGLKHMPYTKGGPVITNSTTGDSSSDSSGSQTTTTNAASSAGNSQTGNGYRKQSDKHAGILIVSPQTHHKASELCDSINSYGPDFVSLSEGLFCDMAAHKTWPLCLDVGQILCFDLEAQGMRSGNATSVTGRRAIAGKMAGGKTYERVTRW
jgi:hypothetical protein